jgi:predicted RNA-binding protein YlxR (DUF448 family)
MSIAGQKKTPLRMCSGCMQRFTKKELIRVVRTPEGEVLLDATGKKSGRGAYICPKAECLKKAQKAKRLERALKTPVSEAVFGQLEEAMRKNEG